MAEKKVNDFNDDDETSLLLFKHRFFSTVVADILKSFENGAFGGSIVQSFCCIDYLGLGMCLDWAKHSSKDFKNYLIDVMGPINIRYEERHKEIYAVRCAWIHTYGIAKATNNTVIPNMNYNKSMLFESDHLHLDKERKLTICISLFISDLIVSIEHFFRNTSIENLKKWESMLFIPSNFKQTIERIQIRDAKKISFTSIHKYLENFDTEASLGTIRRNLIETLDSTLS